MTQAEARASLVQEVIAKLNPPKKKESMTVVDLRPEKPQSPGKIVARFRRLVEDFSLPMKLYLTLKHTGLLRLLYGILVSKFTQDKLKEGGLASVIMPINESAIMKAHLAEWISESVTVMNEKNQEKVMIVGKRLGSLLFGL